MLLRGAQSCLAARSMDRVKPKFLWAYPPSPPHVPFRSSQARPPIIPRASFCSFTSQTFYRSCSL